MLSDYLAVAIRNSRLYGEVAETKQSLEQLIQLRGRRASSRWTRERQDPGLESRRRAHLRLRCPGRDRPPAHRASLPAEPYRTRARALSPRAPGAGLRGRRPSATDGAAAEPRRHALVPHRAATDSLEGMLAIVRDTTAQRELEAQMHQSEKLTALGQMAGGIAHDFNNLLQAILGYAQLMGKNPANVDVVRRGLDVIEKAATGGAETVRRIQKFARLRPDEPFVVAGSQPGRPRLRWRSRGRAGRRRRSRAACRCSSSSSLGPVPVVMGRPAELNEVITNLILNAIDAMPKGGTLRIRTRRAAMTARRSSRWPTPASACRRRCASASSIPSSPPRARRARASGCSVSYSIVKRHGGEMRVDSRPGEGTTFTDRPADRHEPRPARRPAERRAEHPSARDASSSWTTTRRCSTILGEMLKDAGHHVVPVAERGRGPAASSCPAASTSSSPTSGMAEHERLGRRRAASAPAIRNVPVIFITGWGLQEEDQARCRRLGISALLFKPVPPPELHRKVQTALAAVRARGELREVECPRAPALRRPLLHVPDVHLVDAAVELERCTVEVGQRSPASSRPCRRRRCRWR